ncbi:MAG: glycosyltransferase family 4 protein [Planctomycetota bacterium]|nr:glycosyltransferase family 4 protein [Planctomycetota bacterium]
MTQVLDRQDAVLGFVARWVEGLARAADRVRVLALEVGDTTDLPPNVDWVELGRRGAVGRYLRYRRAVRGSVLEGFDGLLTHMVPRYSVVAAPWARRAGISHYLWYTHKGVDQRLLRAIEVVDGVFTASEESMRVDTPKKIVTGHGIDAAHFDVPRTEDGAGPLRLLSVGRLTPAKDPLTVVEALSLLRQGGVDVRLRWAGGALARGDDEYAGMVRRTIEAKSLTDAVDFVGSVPYPDVPALYRDCDLFVNASRTGSVDKVVLEAMAASRPFVSCNEAIPPLLGGALPPTADPEDHAFRAGDPESLADAVRRWIGLDAGARAERSAALARMVRSEHDVDALMARLVRTMEGGAS